MNSQRPNALVVGIGSPNGDDQAGWRVIDMLQTRMAGVCQLRYAKVPHELIDSLDNVDLLHIVDACVVGDQNEGVGRYELVCSEDVAGNHDVALNTQQKDQVIPLPRLRCDTTHHLDLVSVIRLASQLRKLPSRVSVWTIPGRQFGPGAPLDTACQDPIRHCADQIARELADA